jgi:signal transduction histidine kinase/CheY-like chemotaxis protein
MNVNDKEAGPALASPTDLRSIDELRAVHRAALRLQHVVEPEELATETIRVLEETLGYQHAAVLVTDEYSERLVPFALSDQGKGAPFIEQDRQYILSHDVSLDRGITGWVAKHGATVRLGDVRKDPRYVGLRDDILSELCVPMWSHGRVIGIVNVETSDADAYSDSDQRVLEIIASHIAVAIRNNRLQQALVHKERLDAIGRLTSGIAHDFNNMLTVINGHAEILLLRDDLDTQLRAGLEQINYAGRQAAEMTRDLLAFGRKAMLRPQIINTHDTILELTAMLTRVLGENIVLQIDAQDDSSTIEIDPAQFGQVLVNLAINARDAMPDGGTFTLSLKRMTIRAMPLATTDPIAPGLYTLITVSDTGHGMDAITRRSLFEPFFSTKSDGSGLGLAMAHGVILQSGGQIQVESTPGNGTTFNIYLPVADAAPAESVRPDQDVYPPRLEGHVLVVEDEDSVRRLVVSFLESLGYRVLEASCAAQALEIARRPDVTLSLVMSDVVMPRMGGPHLAKKLRTTHPDTKILMMSGYPKHSVDGMGHFVATENLLVKPFTRAALKRKLIEIFAEPPEAN